MTPSAPTQQQIVVGWLFVAAQFLFIIALIALPWADHWPVPTWLAWTGYALIAAGIAVVAVAALRLGPGLTPTPVPNEQGTLTTTGLYRYTRHPIYSGVLLAVVGLVVRSGNIATLLVGLATIAFFTYKAQWEEQRLLDRYPDYEEYAASTGRFVPRLRR